MQPYRLFRASGVEEASVNLRELLTTRIQAIPLPWTLMKAERMTFTLHKNGELIVTRECYFEDSPQPENAPTATPNEPGTPAV